MLSLFIPLISLLFMQLSLFSLLRCIIERVGKLSCSFTSWSCIKEEEILLLSIMGWHLGEYSLLPLIFWFDVSYLLSLVLWAEESFFSSVQQFQ
jgi:hypothetical protein